MSFDAYKVAVKLSLVNNISTGLFAISSQLNRVNRDFNSATASATLLEKKLLDIKRLGLVGGGLAAVGFGSLALFKGPLESVRNLDLADARFKTLNLGATVNQQALEFARGTKVFGASSTDLMNTLRETYGVFGNMDYAKKVAPVLAELNAANATLFGGKIGALDNDAANAIKRVNDMRGLTNNPESFMRGLDLAQKMVTGSGGELKFSDLEQFMKRGGAAAKGLSDDGIMMMATVMQEQGGNATGTALMSMYQNLIAGRTTKKTMAALAQAGLAELGQVTHGAVGGKQYTTTQIKSIKGEELLRTNPGAWLMEYVVPAAKAAGAKTDSEIIKFANDLLSNRTGSNLAATFTTQGLQALRDFKLVKNAMGVDGTIAASKGTLAGQQGNLIAKWENAKSALGMTVLPLAIEAVEGLTSALQSVADFARENPNLTKSLVTGFVALAGAMAIGGTLLLVKTGFSGLGLALDALGGAKGALGSVTSGLSGLTKAAGVFAAAYAGWQLGTALNDHVINPLVQKATGDKNATLGTAIYDWLHGDDVSVTAPKKPVPGAPPSGKSGQMINNTIVMPNGQVLAKVVTQEQEKSMSRPPAGPSTFDPTMNLRVLGSGFA